MLFRSLAEAFSDMGVPVFVADIKGDLTGMCVPGVETKHIRRSIDKPAAGPDSVKSL